MRKENILKVVEQLEEITRYKVKGHNVMVTCPFAEWTHSKGRDSRPSCGILIVDDDESVYNCFACAMAGSLHDMVSELNFRREGKYEELEEAIFELETIDWNGVAEKAGTSAREGAETDRHGARNARRLEADRNEIKNENEMDAYRGSVPRYAFTRGITLESCKAWELGHAKEKKRLVFPFRRAKDRALIGATGRSYVGEEPSYLDIIPFAKAKYLYGEWMVREDAKRFVIVEGQIDVIACWQAGECPLGLSGRFASSDQVRKIVYLAGDEHEPKPVYLFPDGDRAGAQWANQLGCELLEEGIEVYDATAGPDVDPSDLPMEKIPKVLDRAKFRI